MSHVQVHLKQVQSLRIHQQVMKVSVYTQCSFFYFALFCCAFSNARLLITVFRFIADQIISNPNDIGCYIRKICTDKQKYSILKNRWLSDERFNFPANEAQRNLKFQRKWLIEFPWLSYSESLNGGICQYCCFFATKEAGHAELRTFVTDPFTRYVKAKELLRNHENHEYHKNATCSAMNFLDVFDEKVIDISLQLDTAKQKEIKSNRMIMSSIVETILFIGQQGISCRGHRDAGPIAEEIPAQNDGNFRALLRLRMASGDNHLKKHLGTTSSTTRYTSPQIQNELIEICGNIITEKLVMKINATRNFSILADETTDISGIEQFSMCVRYIEVIDDNKVMKEDFLKFVPVHDSTGQG